MTYQKTKDKRIKRRGKIYWARFSKKGIRVQESLFTDDFKMAQAITDKIENAILNGKNYKEVLGARDTDGVPLFDELWPKFIEDIINGNQKRGIKKLRERTVAEYINMGERYFLEFFKITRPDEWDADLWEKYCEFARSKSSRGERLKLFNHWKHFNGFLSWATKLGHIKAKPYIYNPDKQTFKDQDTDTPGINLSDEQLKQLREKSAYHDRFHLYVLMAQFEGMRSSEITQLQKDRIDFKNGIISLKRADTKTGQARDIPIHSEVRDLLKAVYDSNANEFLFPNANDPSRPMDPTGFKKLWDVLREETGVDCRFHDLRHSCATRLFATINPVIACKILGMSMATAMKVYLHFTNDQLAEALEKLKL